MKRAVVVLALAGVVLTARPAVAVVCKTPPAVDHEEAMRRSEVVFVGTVLSVDDVGVNTVAVEAVLKGPPQPRRVLVQGTSGEPGIMTSADRTFQVGEHYVFHPHAAGSVGPGFHDRGGPVRDGLCTATHQVSSWHLVTGRFRPWRWARWVLIALAATLTLRAGITCRRARRRTA